MYMRIIVNLFIVSSWHITVYSLCTWPSTFQNTQWHDSARGLITFETSTMSGWDFSPTSATVVSTWNCVSISSYDVDGRIILITENSFTLFSTAYYAYLCISVTKVTYYSYRYYINQERQGNLNNERIFLYPVKTLTDAGTICSSTGATDGEYQSWIRNGFETFAKINCPWSILGQYGYTVSYPNSQSSCNAVTSQLDMCTNSQHMTFDYTTCSVKVAYSVSDTVWCVDNVPIDGTNYVMLFNGEDTDDLIDDSSYYKFTCMAISDTMETASVSPEYCQHGQTSDSYPISTSGLSIGTILTFSQPTDSKCQRNFCPSESEPVVDICRTDKAENIHEVYVNSGRVPKLQVMTDCKCTIQASSDTLVTFEIVGHDFLQPDMKFYVNAIDLTALSGSLNVNSEFIELRYSKLEELSQGGGCVKISSSENSDMDDLRIFNVECKMHKPTTTPTTTEKSRSEESTVMITKSQTSNNTTEDNKILIAAIVGAISGIILTIVVVVTIIYCRRKIKAMSNKGSQQTSSSMTYRVDDSGMQQNQAYDSLNDVQPNQTPYDTLVVSQDTINENTSPNLNYENMKVDITCQNISADNSESYYNLPRHEATHSEAFQNVVSVDKDTITYENTKVDATCHEENIDK